MHLGRKRRKRRRKHIYIYNSDFDNPELTIALALAMGMIAQSLAHHLRVQGIVLLLAAVASFFAATITKKGLPGSYELRALVFLVITIAVGGVRMQKDLCPGFGEHPCIAY